MIPERVSLMFGPMKQSILTGIAATLITLLTTYMTWSATVGSRLSVIEAQQARGTEDRQEIHQRLQRIEDKLDRVLIEGLKGQRGPQGERGPRGEPGSNGRQS